MASSASPGSSPRLVRVASLDEIVDSSTREVDVSRIRYDAQAADYNSLPTYPTRPSYRQLHTSLQSSTRCVLFDGAPKDPHKPSSTPIYMTATFVQPSVTEFGAYDYTRSGNPTRTALEKHVAALEEAHAAFAFSTGMAALVAVTRLLKAGDELLIGDDVYGGMVRLVSRVLQPLHGIKVTAVDTTDLRKVEAAISPATRMLHFESPTNPMMRISDIRALSALMRSRGILVSVDSTMMSPMLQKPLELGADIVVHSATKFFGGHSDVMGGFVCLRDEELSKRIAFFQNAEGTGLSPFDAWLFLRGIKTLSLRVEKAQANAMAVAEFLSRHPMVTKLHYAGLRPERGDAFGQAQYAMHFGQASGAGCVMSFTTGSLALSRRFIDALRIFKLTVSFGSVHSLCEMPCMMSHASVPLDQRTIPEDLIRLSIGIEDVRDLLHDIDQAYQLASNVHVADVRSVRRRGSSAEGVEALAAPPLPSPSSSEDQADLARSEVDRLEAVVRLLSERLAQAEANAASAEVARRAAVAAAAAGGGGILRGWGGGGDAAAAAASQSDAASASAAPPPAGRPGASAFQSVAVAAAVAALVAWAMLRRRA